MFESEDDLLIAYAVRRVVGDFYPKVTHVSRDRIDPDIDLLIFERERGERWPVGCEFKLVSYRKNWGRMSNQRLYEGLGEAILYLRNGVSQVRLIFGVKEGTPEEKASEWREELVEICEYLKNAFGYSLQYIGIFLMGEYLETLLEPKGFYWHQSRVGRHRFDAIVLEPPRISYSKRLKEEILRLRDLPREDYNR